MGVSNLCLCSYHGNWQFMGDFKLPGPPPLPVRGAGRAASPVCISNWVQGVLYCTCCRVGFREIGSIPNYYYIQGRAEDAFLYCCFTNGGVAFPHTLNGYMFRYYEGAKHCLTHGCNTITALVRKLLNS
jgi:hypothetical protein